MATNQPPAGQPSGFRSVRWATVAVLALALTACGSTVQGAGATSAVAGPQDPGLGLGPAQPAGPAVPGALPSVAPGGGSGAVSPGAPVAQPGSAPGDGTQAAAPPASAGSAPGGQAPGTARNTKPLSLGFLVSSDNQAASAIGADNDMTITYRDAAAQLVAEFNARGGLAGRKIEPVYYDVNTQGDYNTQLAEACALFTEDNRVAAVVDVINSVQESFEACLAKAQVPHVNSSFSTADSTLLAQTPSLLAPTAPSLDRQITGVLQGLHDSGYVTSKNKLGVLYEECPYTQRPLALTLRPLAKKLGVQVTEAGVKCIRAFNDVAEASRGLSSAVLAFKNAGVDRVTFVSTFEGTLLLLFSKAAEPQLYRPGYVLSTQALLALVPPQMDAEQRKDLRGMGWVPAIDTSAAKSPAAPAATTRCLGLYASRGLKPQTNTDRLLMFTQCAGLFLLEQALTATAGDSSRAALVGAVQNMQGTFSSPATLDGATHFAAGHHDGAVRLREMRWDTSCSCAQYISAPRNF
jgi:ABC-type branched-subunit amino acid transport system substrate-binding protein